MTFFRSAVMTVFVWLNMLLLGALLFETSILYPNQFHDVPRSLELSNGFMTEAGIGNFMRPAGMATVVAGVVVLAVTWREPRVRRWVAASLLVLVAANFVFSVLYFWPANAVMFTEGTAMHSPEMLRDVATAFVRWNAVRIVGCSLAAVLAFVAFVTFMRTRPASHPASARRGPAPQRLESAAARPE